jgi:1,4-alpha-glucan branching enzyme
LAHGPCSSVAADCGGVQPQRDNALFGAQKGSCADASVQLKKSRLVFCDNRPVHALALASLVVSRYGAPTSNVTTNVNESEFARIVAGDHPDPHAILGPHLHASGLVVHVFRPGATQVILRPDDVRVKPRVMARLHPGGIFGARFVETQQPFAYRIEARTARGVSIARDPYAYPPTIDDEDFDPAAPLAHLTLARRLGAHVVERAGVTGTFFAVWAPSARRVSVVGEFNKWDGRRHAMRRTKFGVWEIFAPDVGEGAAYKYEIKTGEGIVLLKSDPVARAAEVRPAHASKVVSAHHVFDDKPWMEARGAHEMAQRPLSIYEVHLGSFRRVRRSDKLFDWSSYRELSAHLVDHVAALGFTHVELLPVMEHPFDGSWGYQVTGYFAPTSRFGSPDDLRRLVDHFHARGIGVILDWPPAHFPKDAFALGRFDGTPLYEHADSRLGEHREWGTFVFDYGNPAVRNFLIASALYWIESFHADGLRVDAVASMLYLDYAARDPSEWVPNEKGGRENWDAVLFLRELTRAVHEKFPGVILCAEESTTWPGVTQSTEESESGLGFDFKWNMGWMHDTLDYFRLDPIYRSKHHKNLTFGMMYAYSERFLLPLSHDEVVHLKKSLLSKMPGDRWKQHANLRALYGLQWAHPGKKLLFMGGEIGQWKEWNHDAELDWGLLVENDHAGLGRLLHDLNAIYRQYTALWQLDADPAGFTWINPDESLVSVVSFVRFPRSADGANEPCPKKIAQGTFVVCVGNFTPVVRRGYRIGVPRYCRYIEVLNTDALVYGGSGVGNMGIVACEKIAANGFPQSIVLTLPPLAMLYLVPEDDADPLPEEPGSSAFVTPLDRDAVDSEDANDSDVVGLNARRSDDIIPS